MEEQLQFNIEPSTDNSQSLKFVDDYRLKTRTQHTAFCGWLSWWELSGMDSWFSIRELHGYIYSMQGIKGCGTSLTAPQIQFFSYK